MGKIFYGTDSKVIAAGMQLKTEEVASDQYDEEGNCTSTNYCKKRGSLGSCEECISGYFLSYFSLHKYIVSFLELYTLLLTKFKILL